MKDIVFGRIKAYNLVQMFQYVTEALEIYYKRRLLSVAHNRFDHFIAKKYKGFNAHAIPADKIHKRDDSPFQFIVGSTWNWELVRVHRAGMALPVCTRLQ